MKAYIFLSALLFPFISFAQVRFTEVMYDPPGTDTGREWVEVLNDTSSSINISSWKLFENDTNHKISFPEGKDVVPAGGYLVIADNAEKFQADWPQFQGLLLDSTFSLKNTGEKLAIFDTETELASLEYLPPTEVQADGLSLQFSQNKWRLGNATPGSAPSPDTFELPAGSDENTEDDESSVSSIVASTSTQTVSVEEISARIKAPQTILAGVDTYFTGEGFGVKGTLLLNARYLWNFGDGAVASGVKVAHTYRYPGEYTLVLDVGAGELVTTVHKRLKVIEAKLSITGVKTGEDGFIKISNPAAYEIDISGWHIRADKEFTFPSGSFLPPKVVLSLPTAITGIIANEYSSISFLYPNKTMAFTYVLSDERTTTSSENIVNKNASPADLSPQSKTTTSKITTKQNQAKEDTSPLGISKVASSSVLAFGTQQAAAPSRVSDNRTIVATSGTSSIVLASSRDEDTNKAQALFATLLAVLIAIGAGILFITRKKSLDLPIDSG